MSGLIRYQMALDITDWTGASDQLTSQSKRRALFALEGDGRLLGWVAAAPTSDRGACRHCLRKGGPHLQAGLEMVADDVVVLDHEDPEAAVVGCGEGAPNASGAAARCPAARARR